MVIPSVSVPAWNIPVLLFSLNENAGVVTLSFDVDSTCVSLNIFPVTCNLSVAPVVAIPTFPELSTRSLSVPPVVIAIVDAPDG